MERTCEHELVLVPTPFAGSEAARFCEHVELLVDGFCERIEVLVDGERIDFEDSG